MSFQIYLGETSVISLMYSNKSEWGKSNKDIAESLVGFDF